MMHFGKYEKIDLKDEASSKDGSKTRDHLKDICREKDKCSEEGNKIYQDSDKITAVRQSSSQEVQGANLSDDRYKEVSIPSFMGWNPFGEWKPPQIQEQDRYSQQQSPEASTSGPQGREVSQEIQREVQYYSLASVSTPEQLQQKLDELVNGCCSSQDRSTIKAGQQLGEYQLVRKLGQGSFGKVFLGEHILSKERVAVKVQHSEPISGGSEFSPSELEQRTTNFCKEIKTLANLDHPNIVRVLGFGYKGKVPFLVMEYVPGGTLVGKRLSLPQVVECMKQICSAVNYTHENGIIHRDLKHDNILQRAGCDFVLTDYGLAAPVGTRGAIGARAYIAPEQLDGKACLPESEVYALGVMAYECHTGKNPKMLMEKEKSELVKDWLQKKCDTTFNLGYQERLKFKYLSKKVSNWIISKHISKMNASENREFFLVLARAMDKDPEKRPRDAKAFARSLWQVVSREQPGERLEEKESLQDLEFYKIPNHHERREYYLGLGRQDRIELLSKLPLGYCLDLYQSLDNQDRIEFYKMLGHKEQRKLYTILEPDQQQALMIVR